MKQPVVIATLILITLLATTLYVAAAPPGGPCGGPGSGPCGCATDNETSNDGPYLQRMTKVLDLTEAQQASIKKIHAAERETTAALRAKKRENREALRRAEVAQPFDESTVRALAEQRGNLETELTVAKARVHNQIEAILTPEQRELAAKLRPEPGEGRKERHHGR